MKENKGDSRNRYRMSDKTALELGLIVNKSGRYRLSDGIKKDLRLIKNSPRVMIYDIETSRIDAKLWWTGKQFVGHKQVRTEPKIISICWKWVGNDEVYSLVWDKKHNDKKMLRKFLKQYNKADLVIGQNNDKFDNRWVNARALKHRLFVNVFVKSLDIMKQSKRLFRIISYSMDYTTKFINATFKQSHEGMVMWDKIEEGTKHEQKEYLAKMVDYNVGDIVSTEDMYVEMTPYIGQKIHLGVLMGGEKSSCPSCGSDDVKMFKKTFTAVGTVQRVMHCNKCRSQYKISNREYLKSLI